LDRRFRGTLGQGVGDHAGWNRLSRLETCEKDEGQFGDLFIALLWDMILWSLIPKRVGPS